LLVHDGPAPFPPDAGTVMLDGLVVFVGVGLVTLLGTVVFARLVILVLGITVNVADLEPALYPIVDACIVILNVPGLEFGPIIKEHCDSPFWLVVLQLTDLWITEA
jgi:hypothetical protein